MLAAQMNVRLDPASKATGDRVLERFGITPSDAVRGLWDHLSTRGTLPSFLKREQKDSQRAKQADDPIEQSAGLLHRYAVAQGLCSADEPLFSDGHLEELASAAKEERVDAFMREALDDRAL